MVTTTQAANVSDVVGRFTSLTTREFFLLTLALTLAIGFAIYGQFLHHWFLTDDFVWLDAASNPHLAAFLKGTVEFPRGPTPYWRPAVDLYFFAMFRVFHLNATAYHVVNLLMHVSTACLTSAIMLRVSKSRAVALLAALMFLASPAFGNVVTWASAATELLATCFGCLSIIAFLNYQDGWRDARWLLVSVTAFAIALLAHEMAIAVVPAMLLFAVISQPPKDRAQLRGLALALLPIIALAVVYVAVQLTQVLHSSTPQNYEVNRGGLHHLVDRLLWLAVPIPAYKGDWIEPARWAVLAVSMAAAGISVLRAKFVLSGLFLATVFVAFPTAFLTVEFAPRWMYFAAVPWSSFVAVLLTGVTGWLRARQPAVAYVALAAVLLVAGFRFVPETIDAQRWIPGQGAQMESISRSLQTNCSTMGNDAKVIVLPLPVVDPGYAVSSLVDLLFPGADVVRASPQMQPPRGSDCLLEHVDGQYRATSGSTVDTERYWIFAPAASCPNALPWQQAGHHVGETRTISGPLSIARTNPSGDESLLEIDSSKMAARISGADGHDAWQIFRNAAPGSALCITGTIRAVKGALFIDVTSARDVALAANTDSP